ncbi:SAM-dependent methyltransferase [Anaerolineales bacterium HSG24]|nr:SAM-dependent methyltransferase [Anaerolineales bacterium HSG24]
MPKNGVEQKPSETAMFAAIRRAIANKEYKSEKFGPDYMAEFFLPAHFKFFLRFKKIRAITNNKLNSFLPGLNEYMIARTAYFDSLFVNALNSKTAQIVLLGAGYDSRAYRFAKSNLGTTVFELDIAPTQDKKMECLRKARISIPKHVTFVPIDFNKEPLKDALEKAGYKSHQKTLFIWEGVSYYLDAKSVDSTLEFVSHASHHESAIAFDYTISISEENIDEYYGVKDFAKTMAERHENEELMFSIDEGETELFLEQRGLRMINHLDNQEIEGTFLLDENGSLIGQITGHFRFVMATPEETPKK